MTREEVIQWLLEGDVSVRYQVYRDLLSQERRELKNRIAGEGWGAKYLSKRHPDGHWGDRFYQPKWTSTHYTLLDLRNLSIVQDNPLVQDSINQVVQTEIPPVGGIISIGKEQKSDVCVNGMFLNYASYFKTKETHLKTIVDFILSQRMPDGGFNCRLNRSGAKHSSLHSTLSVAEGITEYEQQGYTYRLSELKSAQQTSVEFILQHQLFVSDRTGQVIKDEFLRLTYPGRWKYNILRALDYFQHARLPWDDRMEPAIAVLKKKRNKDGTWNLPAHHPGKFHFKMEAAGKPSRWNTLRCLRVFKYFDVQD